MLEFLRKLFGGEKVLYEKKTKYNDILVVDDGEKIKLFLDSSGNIHSVFVRNSFITNSYWDVCAFASLLLCEKDILILGFGGGSISKIVKTLFPEIKVFGVDIDKEVFYIAHEFFNTKVDFCIVSDFYTFIDFVRKKFSSVIIDVFDRATLPPTLFLRSFWEKLYTKSKSVVINTVSVFQAEGLESLAKDFYKKTKVIKSRESSNYILVCSDSFELEQKAYRIKNTLQKKFENSEISIRDFRNTLSVLDYIIEDISAGKDL